MGGVSALALSIVSTPTEAGHESPFYPSFYPQEIRLETLDPALAIDGWPKARVHTYVGSDVFDGAAVPPDAAPVTSLRSYAVLTFDATSGHHGLAHEARARCAAARAMERALLPVGAGFVASPYPVTPYHDDYLRHFDRIARALSPTRAAVGTAATLRIRAKGALAQALVPGELRADADWDATLEEIDVGTLVDSSAFGPGNFVGAPWSKQGWYQAYQLYAGALADPHARDVSNALYRDLVTGRYRGLADRINRERALVAALSSTCERVVVGYTLRREYLDTEYSSGAENAAFDSQAGFAAAIFPRTVKLKDFPWNGWLRVGTASPPAAAWNPIGGFTDLEGRMLWLAIGEPALFPAPYGGSWIANRVNVESSSAGAVAIPSDALKPAIASGALQPVGAGKSARRKLRLTVVASAFHDGTATEFADIVYPYVFAFRWGDARNRNAGTYDPTVAIRTEFLREWLAGFKRIGDKTEVLNFGDDLKFRHRMEIVDVYLNHPSSDAFEAAAAASPWSTLPWEVLVLMEEAVQRGMGAFSAEEARRRAVPWLDLIRNAGTNAELSRLVEQFRTQGYRPEALRALVTEAQARERWAALGRFYAEHGHFLVTNGPYRLDAWSAGGAVLQVFRDLSYPKGVGSLDAYAIPLRAFVTGTKTGGGKLIVSGAAEHIVRAQRSYAIERAPLGRVTLEHADDEARPECRYLVIAPDGKVVRAGIAGAGSGGAFVIGLDGLAPALYKVALALYVQGNAVNVEPKIFEYRAGARGSSARDTFSTRASH